MQYAISKTLKEDYNNLVQRIEDQLKSMGFGIVSTIEVDKILKEKIGAEFKRYTILGACNPHFAFEALGLEEHLGVLLPCNIVVIDQGNGKVEVAAMEPADMMQQLQNPRLTEIAGEVSDKMRTFIDQL